MPVRVRLTIASYFRIELYNNREPHDVRTRHAAQFMQYMEELRDTMPKVAGVGITMNESGRAALRGVAHAFDVHIVTHNARDLPRASSLAITHVERILDKHLKRRGTKKVWDWYNSVLEREIHEAVREHKQEQEKQR